MTTFEDDSFMVFNANLMAGKLLGSYKKAGHKNIKTQKVLFLTCLYGVLNPVAPDHAIYSISR